MKGFDYLSGQPVERNVAEWRAALANVMAAGGMRHVEDGETFAKGADGRLVFEVYGIVQPAKPARRGH